MRAAEDNIRLLECWLSIDTKEDIGIGLCLGCQYIGTCKWLYEVLCNSDRSHPAGLAKKIIFAFGIPSRYLDEKEQ